MNSVLLTYYYPPDLGAGSYRALALAKALDKSIKSDCKVHVVTTTPNRYFEFSPSDEQNYNHPDIEVHKIKVSNKKKNIINEILSFSIFSFGAIKVCLKLKPQFIVSTSSRFMTVTLGFIISILLNSKHFIDLRDIFSETISDLLTARSKLFSSLLKTIFFIPSS